MAESVESGEISSSRFKWNLDSAEIFVTYLNNNSENKIEKSIKKYFNLFIYTSLNHISIRSRLVSQPRNKLNSNSEQSFNATDLSLITFGVLLFANPRGKKSTNSQISLWTSDENRNSRVPTIKILLDSGANVSIICKDVLNECHKILKKKR